MKFPVISGRTTAGGAIYAAIDTRAGAPLRKGVVAHSGAVASLAPFTSIDDAVAEIERLGRAPGPEETTR